MKLTLQTFQDELVSRLKQSGLHDADDIAWACGWLEACGYPGLAMLVEALEDEAQDIELERDALGLDLQGVSCAFLAPRIIREFERAGRVFLRNVRHGLYVLPFAVRNNIGIGCPVDPAFAVGGERTKNPYFEKLSVAQSSGLEIDGALWHRILT